MVHICTENLHHIYKHFSVINIVPGSMTKFIMSSIPLVTLNSGFWIQVTRQREGLGPSLNYAFIVRELSSFDQILILSDSNVLMCGGLRWYFLMICWSSPDSGLLIVFWRQLLTFLHLASPLMAAATMSVSWQTVQHSLQSCGWKE